jgi:hypothetical protein
MVSHSLSLSTHISHVRLITNRGNSDKFHSLKVSYDHLEERVRGCFLVCSLYSRRERTSGWILCLNGGLE